MDKFFYVVTIHNREQLIKDVLGGIERCHSGEREGHIICVVDGCVDKTSEMIDQFVKEKQDNKNLMTIHKIYQNDIHEILSLNSALEFIRDNLNPQYNDIVLTLQDDVVLQEPAIDIKSVSLFENFEFLGYVSMRIGCSLYSKDNSIHERDLIESEFGHWNQLGWKNHKNLNHGELVFVETAIRSPAMFQWGKINEIGFFDPNLAPMGYDCHDMSIRMINNGNLNAVVGFRFRSDVDWGAMRAESNSYHNSKAGQIYDRNRAYLVQKHKSYFEMRGKIE